MELMEKEQTNVPAGYKRTEVGVIPEDWEVVPLGTVADLYQPETISAVKFTQHGFPVYGANGVVGFYDRTNHDTWQVTVTCRGSTCGTVNRTVDKCWITGNAMVLNIEQNKKLNKEFFYHLLTVQDLSLCITGTGQPQIVRSPLARHRIPLPPTKAEQEAIAEALNDADAWIASLEQLIQKKRLIKQGAMQSLLTGKHRLPGFTGKWESLSLGQLLTIRHGRNQNSVEDRFGKYPILGTGGEIGRANQFLYDRPSVLIGRKGTIDRPQFKNTPFWSVDTLFYSEIHEPNNAKFLFYRFCLIPWRRYNEASGVPSLNASTIEQLEIQVPESEEQTAIATVLSDMDAEIDALETKLAKARQIKQGMMQELLTGRKRLL